MRVKLILDDWRSSLTGESVYLSKLGNTLSSGVFHSGTTFDAEIILDREDAKELEDILTVGHVPVFIVSLP